MLPLMASQLSSHHALVPRCKSRRRSASPASIVPWGFLTLTAGLIWPAVRQVLAAPLALLTALLHHTVEWFAALPHWSYRIPTPPFWLTILFFALAIAIATLRTQRRHAAESAQALRALLGSIDRGGSTGRNIPLPANSRGSANLNRHILDVGQGDSIFLVSPHGKTHADRRRAAHSADSQAAKSIPAPIPGEEAVSPYLWSRGFKRIDVVALTHAHQDHLGGLTAILENFKVSELWLGREVDSRAWSQLEALASTTPDSNQARNRVAKHSRGTASKVNSSGRKSAATEDRPKLPKTTTRWSYA